MHAFGNAFRGKRVLVTGHTGFKGAWLALWLQQLGATVIGFAQSPPTEPSLFGDCRLDEWGIDVRGDICDIGEVRRCVDREQPDAIFHLAAQALVLDGYTDPPRTFAVNVLGTANVLEAARRSACVRAVVAVTSDKVYRNQGWPWGYRETDALGGHDPYSASKSAAEMVIASYQWSHTQAGRDAGEVAIASARGGNVIGGGDWAAYRLIPDTIHAIANKQDIVLRSPKSTRPWQHVFDCLSGYLTLASRLLTGEPQWRSAWNFGPTDSEATCVEAVCRRIIERWPAPDTKIRVEPGPGGAEMVSLRVDSSKAIHQLRWWPTWGVTTSVDRTLEWYRYRAEHGAAEMRAYSIEQLRAYVQDAARLRMPWAGCCHEGLGARA